MRSLRMPLSTLLCATILCLYGFGPASGSPSTPSGPITILVAADKSWVPGAIKDFEASTGIRVNPVIVDFNNIITKFTVAAAGGVSAYDVVETDPTSALPFAKAGYLAPMDRYVRPMASDLVKVDEFPYNGHLYGMPWFMDTQFFLYNRELLAKAGFTKPPATWDDFTHQAQVLKQKGITQWPVTFQWKQIEGEYGLLQTVMLSNGCRMFDAHSKPVLTDPACVAALQMLADLNLKYHVVNPSSFTFNQIQAATELAQGRSAYAIIVEEATRAVSDPSRSRVVGRVDVGLIPHGPNAQTASVDGSETLSIAASSRQKDRAWQLIRYLISRKVESAALADANILPALKVVYADSALTAKQPWLPSFLRQLKYVHARVPQATWYSQASHIMQVESLMALTGQKSARSALADANRQIAALH